MIKILFERSEKAFLPEIDAYIEYFNSFPEFEAFDSSKLGGKVDTNEFDVIWKFMGFDRKKYTDQFIVHEYASLSNRSFKLIKNILKSKFNSTPDLRIFLNEDVKDKFHFSDNVKYLYRDMGVNKMFFNKKISYKEFDFVYVGPISKEREIHVLLRNFTERINGTICMIGNVEDSIYKKYKNNKDIVFTGIVKNKEVADIASKAIYGVNYIPDKLPYNIQTSTKILEYLALGLNIVTTDYKWVNDFEKANELKFFKLKSNDFNKQNIEKFNFHCNNSCVNNWEETFQKSRVKEILLERLIEKRRRV